jgi:hypothetical protein
VRIEGPSRNASSIRRNRSSGDGSGVFRTESGGSAPRAPAASPAAPATGIGALLALQSIDDPTQSRRRAIRRGRNLLDALEGLRADLLTGQVGEGRLNRILALVGQAKLETDPELETLLADIELRARVELAKLGVFPGG